uniref:RING-type domain-containing protein n=1 Tax=Oryza meridionalis TaxID=40149 RepID=A0A0E0DWH1_9ORYZ
MAAPPSIDDEDDDDGSSLLDHVALQYLLTISGERALQILQNANMPLHLDLDLDLDDGGGFRDVPASAAAVAGLEKQVFEVDHHDDDEEEEAKDSAVGCVICMEEFVAGDEVCAIPCAGNHSFHHHCITEWLGCSNGCPLYRHALPVEEQDEGIVEGGRSYIVEGVLRNPARNTDWAACRPDGWWAVPSFGMASDSSGSVGGQSRVGSGSSSEQ